MNAWLLFAALEPTTAFGMAAYRVKRPEYWWTALLLRLVAFGLGVLSLNFALQKSCEIGEAQCFRTGILTYFVWCLWGLATLAFLGRSILISREMGKAAAEKDQGTVTVKTKPQDQPMLLIPMFVEICSWLFDVPKHWHWSVRWLVRIGLLLVLLLLVALIITPEQAVRA